MKKGKEKRGKVTIKKGESYNKKGGKGLKIASFWAINSKKIALPSRTADLFVREKNESHKRGG